MIHSIAPTFISEMEIFPPKRNHLSVIKENTKDSLLHKSEQAPDKMRHKSAQYFMPSRPSRRVAVAPHRHPVYDLPGGHVENVAENCNVHQNSEINMGTGDCDLNTAEIVTNCPELTLHRKLSDKLDENDVETLSSHRNQIKPDHLKEENHAKDMNVYSLRNERISTENSRGLVKSESYKDKSLKDYDDATSLGVRCQPKPVLDRDLYSWREKVKECGSFPSLPDKFRPLRRSVGNYGNGSNMKSDPCSYEAKAGDASEKCQGLGQEVVRFYIPGQKPDYLINPNTVVTRHPGQSKMHYTDSPKLSTVVRKYSLQDPGVRRPDDVVNDDCARSEVTVPNHNDQSYNEFDDYGSGSSNPEYTENEESLDIVPPVIDNEHGKKKDHVLSGGTQDQSHYHILKETIAHLKLPTRRASTMAWRAQYVDNFSSGNGFYLARGYASGQEDGPLTQERKDNIDRSLEKLRRELVNIRQKDQDLAKQFLTIRHTINKLRWNVQCHSHEQLLEEVEDDIVELRDLSRVVDTPTDLLSTTSFLKHFGLTRMNITSRRFSTC